MNGPVVIDEFGDVEEEAVYSFHRGNCKMSGIGISTPHQQYQRGRLGDGERRRLGVTKSQAPISEVPRSSLRPRGPLARRELRGIQFSKKLSSPLRGRIKVGVMIRSFPPHLYPVEYFVLLHGASPHPPPGQRPFRAGGQGRGEAIHPPSRAGGYSGIFL